MLRFLRQLFSRERDTSLDWNNENIRSCDVQWAVYHPADLWQPPELTLDVPDIDAPDHAFVRAFAKWRRQYPERNFYFVRYDELFGHVAQVSTPFALMRWVRQHSESIERPKAFAL